MEESKQLDAALLAVNASDAGFDNEGCVALHRQVEVLRGALADEVHPARHVHLERVRIADGAEAVRLVPVALEASFAGVLLVLVLMAVVATVGNGSFLHVLPFIAKCFGVDDNGEPVCDGQLDRAEVPDQLHVLRGGHLDGAALRGALRRV